MVMYLWLLIDWSIAGWVTILIVDRHALEARLNRTNRHFATNVLLCRRSAIRMVKRQ